MFIKNTPSHFSKTCIVEEQGRFINKDTQLKETPEQKNKQS